MERPIEYEYLSDDYFDDLIFGDLGFVVPIQVQPMPVQEPPSVSIAIMEDMNGGLRAILDAEIEYINLKMSTTQDELNKIYVYLNRMYNQSRKAMNNVKWYLELNRLNTWGQIKQIELADLEFQLYDKARELRNLNSLQVSRYEFNL